MIDFKEKVRSDVNTILESKEELSEAQLKEFLGFSSEKRRARKDAKTDAEQRYHYLAVLSIVLGRLLRTVEGIQEHKEYFTGKALTREEATRFLNSLKALDQSFREAADTIGNIFGSSSRMLSPIIGNQVDISAKGKKK